MGGSVGEAMFWVGGWFISIIMPSLAQPTGPSVAIPNIFNKMLKLTTTSKKYKMEDNLKLKHFKDRTNNYQYIK